MELGLIGICTCVLLFTILPGSHGQSTPKQDPAALALLRTSEAARLTPKASPISFRLTATIHTFNLEGKADGDATLTEDLLAGVGRKTTLALSDKVSTTYELADGRTAAQGDDLPYWAEAARDALLSPTQSAGSLFGQDLRTQKASVGDLELQCVITTRVGKLASAGSHQAFCFSGQPVLLRAIDRDDHVHTAFGRFLKLDSVYTPGDLLLSVQGRQHVSLHVDEWKSTTTLKEEDVLPPAGKELSADADAKLEGGGRISGSAPVYPDLAKRQRLEGHVLIATRVEKDGRLSHFELVDSSNMVFNEAALQAVKDWKYAPASINGKPTEVDTLVSVNFLMHP